MRVRGLSEEQVNQRVSDSHMEEMSRCFCSRWRRLYPHLGLERIDVTDIDVKNTSEEEKRQAFFAKWREKMGYDATYQKLLCALLKIDSREDAEGVCNVLNLEP